jgi:hypothetical protein
MIHKGLYHTLYTMKILDPAAHDWKNNIPISAYFWVYVYTLLIEKMVILPDRHLLKIQLNELFSQRCQG